MDSLQQMGSGRHEYRFKNWYRWFYLLFGVVVIAGGFFMAAKILSEPDLIVLAATMMIFPIMGLYILAYALRSRLILDGSRIIVRGVFKEKAADLSEVEGSRIVSSRNGSYMLLYLKEGRGKITISQSFDTDDDYRAWFQKIIDLDARDRDALLAEISQDAELGSTPEDRLAALKQAKTINIAAIAFTIAVAIGVNLNLTPANYRLFLSILLALAPFAVMMLIHRSPLLYSLFKKEADPRADVAFILMAAGFGLAFTAADIEFVSMKPLLFLNIPVALICIAAFYGPSRKYNSQVAVLFGVLFVSLPYSFGLAVAANKMLDRAKPAIYIVPITGKHESHGKSTTYYLELAPWGPIDHPNEISVASDFYRDIQPGDQVCLGLHPGRLHAAWYQLAECPAQTTPAQTP
jgi:hypothetical protein